jgi:hypothetical protein
MNKLFMIFVVVILMAGLTNKVVAQIQPQTAQNQARAEVLSALGLVAVNPLEFGGFTSAAAGTVVLSPLAVRTATGGVTLYTTSITPTAASYTLTGSPNTHYTIVVPTTNQLLVHVGNSASMAANNFTCSYPLLASTLGNTGSDAFTVGATLDVAASQAAGLYSGFFDVTIAY